MKDGFECVESSCGPAAFFLHGNTHIALLAVALVGSTFVWMGRPLQPALLAAAAAGAFLIYQIDRAWHSPAEDVHNQPGRVDWVRSHRAYVWGSSAGALLIIAASVPSLGTATVATGTVLGAMGVVYLLPVFPGRARLKRNLLAKPIAICTAWAFGAVFLPAIESDMTLNADLALLFAYRFLFLLPNVLLADWPDRSGDHEVGLRSAAIVLSTEALWRTAHLLCAASLAVGGVLAWRTGWPSPASIDLLGPVALFVAIGQPGPRSRWYYNVTLDLVAAWPAVCVGLALLQRT